MKKNATYLSVAAFDELQLAINKHIETGMAMELSLLDKFTLGVDESTSMSDTLYIYKVCQSHNKHAMQQISVPCSTRKFKECQFSTQSNR